MIFLQELNNLQRMKWQMLCWLVFLASLDMFSHNCVSSANSCVDSCHCKIMGRPTATACMECVSVCLKGGYDDTVDAMKIMQRNLEQTDMIKEPICVKNFVALLYKPSGPFEGLNIYASETEARTEPHPNSRLSAELPKELGAGPQNKIVFSMIKLPDTNMSTLGAFQQVYDQRLVGLSVQGKTISGLSDRVNITMNFTTDINETRKPSCQFFDFLANNFSEKGCSTNWNQSQSNITCSCDHLTYFAVLMVSASPSSKDQEILTYITLIGCSLSLFALVFTLLLFITNRKLRGDVSMKVHINLVIALILLNVHFLPNEAVAALSSTGLCLYMALLLHYSLLATFSWMALEGFHLYLLLVKVFNISISKYLFKLSMVGWGVPAVIVSVVVITDSDLYGRIPPDMSNSNDTAICYITNENVKKGTTLGPFSLVFLFNVIMFIVTVQRVLIHRSSKEFGQSNRDRAKKDICTLLGVTTLLGITWGLVFFSFSYLGTAGLYLFCILNSLQGFFIFLWFLLSLRKAKISSTKTSSETRSTSG